MDALKHSLEGRFADLNVSVREVAPNTFQDTSSFGVSADVLDNTGRRVGSCTHDVYRLDDGGLAAVVRKIHLEPGVRGDGFGAEFSRAWEDWLIQSGANRIELRANIDVGSYAWARQGYDFANHAEAVRNIRPRLENGIADHQRGLEDLLRQRDHVGDSPDLAQQIEQRQQLLEHARDVAARMQEGSDQFPTPREISELGRPDGLQPGQSRDARWLGKDVLMDPSGKGIVEWQAVKRL